MFGLLFLVVILAALVLFEITVAAETHVFGLLALAILASLTFFGVLPIFTWIAANPYTFLVILGLYVAGGITWGFIKWYFHLLNIKDNLNPAYKESYGKDTSVPNETYYEYLVRKRYILQAKDCKFEISVWMVWWPFSIIWTVMNDFVRRFYNWVIDKCIAIFNAISAHVFKGL